MVDLINSGGFAIALFVGLIALAVHEDVAALRIPNRISLAIAALYPAYAVATGVPAVSVAAAVGVAALVFVVGTVLFGFRLIGGGDVKLMAAVSLWAGAAGVPAFLITTTLAGGAIALLMSGRRRFALAAILTACGADEARERLLGAHIPYAVAIAAGTYLAVLPGLLRSPAG